MELTPEQSGIAAVAANQKVLLRGSAGTGKTTAGVGRALYLLDQGVSASSILILTPQRSLQTPYEEAILARSYAGGEMTFATVGGLARRMCELFWPLAAERAGFRSPDQPPVFLTLETAQYYMAHLVRPKLEEGLFDAVTIDRNRLYSQILDNLNKSALVGFDHREITDRLSAAWTGDPAQRRIYEDAQACASLFREYCLEHNLLDFSLQLDIFANVLWNDTTVRNHLYRSHRHLIYDNLEEDAPRAHDLLEAWLPGFESALLICDEGGGFRQFLGADPVSAQRFDALVDEVAVFADSFVQSAEMAALEGNLVEAIRGTTPPSPSQAEGSQAYNLLLARYHPELLDMITGDIHALLEQGIPPSGIVILAPYLSDALRFALMNRLDAAGIPVRSHRPSRSLRDEPASQAMLSLAALAHPDWQIRPTRFDMAYAFMLALNTDLVRAQLLAEITYRQKDLGLSAFEDIKPEMQERITYALGERYATLKNWILAYRDSEPLPLDHFLRKVFGEVLSQPDFGFHRDFDRARVAASLIESVRKFRLALDPTGLGAPFDLGKEYLLMLQDGVIAASYVESWKDKEKDAVLVAPATTFLMMNRPATVQFWLDIGSSGWVERLFQPLTHPYVLGRNWPAGRPWTDADEVETSREVLARTVSGLLKRCRQRVQIGLSELGESGYEQRGELLRAFQKILPAQG